MLGSPDDTPSQVWKKFLARQIIILAIVALLILITVLLFHRLRL
jgi:hypothetical protein